MIYFFCAFFINFGLFVEPPSRPAPAPPEEIDDLPKPEELESDNEEEDDDDKDEKNETDESDITKEEVPENEKE